MLAHRRKPNRNTSRRYQDIDLRCEAENHWRASIDTSSLRTVGREFAAETCDIAMKMAYGSAWGVRKSAPAPGRAPAITVAGSERACFAIAYVHFRPLCPVTVDHDSAAKS